MLRVNRHRCLRNPGSQTPNAGPSCLMYVFTTGLMDRLISPLSMDHLFTKIAKYIFYHPVIQISLWPKRISEFLLREHKREAWNHHYRELAASSLRAGEVNLQIDGENQTDGIIVHVLLKYNVFLTVNEECYSLGLQIEGHPAPLPIAKGGPSRKDDRCWLHVVYSSVIQPQLVASGAGRELQKRMPILLGGGGRGEGDDWPLRVLALFCHKVKANGALHGGEEVDGIVAWQCEVWHSLTEFPSQVPWFNTFASAHSLYRSGDVQGFQKINHCKTKTKIVLIWNTTEKA